MPVKYGQMLVLGYKMPVYYRHMLVLSYKFALYYRQTVRCTDCTVSQIRIWLSLG